MGKPATSESWGTKHRPQKLDDLIGNRAAKAQLRGYMKAGFPRVTLLTGATGNGKTTVARIIGAMLNDVPQHKNPDFKEINIATQGGIDSIRELIDTGRYKPMGNFRIFMLDEAHRLTLAARNALLKGLEEPPSHLVWILATNHPESVPPEVKGRASAITLEAPTAPECVELLERVIASERVRLKKLGVRRPERWLTQLAESSGCQPRLSLNTLQAACAGLRGGLSADAALEAGLKSAGQVEADNIEMLVYLMTGSTGKLLAKMTTVPSPLGMVLSWNSHFRFLMEHTAGANPTASWWQRKLLERLRKPDINVIYKAIVACNRIKSDVTVSGVDEWASAIEHLVPVTQVSKRKKS